MVLTDVSAEALTAAMSPSLYHSAIAVNISGELVKQKEFRAHFELTVVIDGVDYQPDISVYKRKKLHYISEQDEPKTAELPLLAIEIVSPSQTMNELIRKADFYVESGIQSVWIVHPQTHSITVKRNTTISFCFNFLSTMDYFLRE
ncbi:MAG: Uma2 family endonuclease [Candidatus Electrothrix sp. AUS1_2]|nr:Uma2 family endonuclease [Candidatus Electrothrix sp. AUS1_2]